MAKEPILSVKNLEVKFKVRDRVLTAIRNISLDFEEHKVVAIVGESRDPRQEDCYSLPGPDDLPEPGQNDRLSDLRSHHEAPGQIQGRSQRRSAGTDGKSRYP